MRSPPSPPGMLPLPLMAMLASMGGAPVVREGGAAADAPSITPDTLLVRDAYNLERLEKRLGEPVDGTVLEVIFEPTIPARQAVLYNRGALARALPKLLGLVLSGEGDPGLMMLIRVVKT